MTIGWFDDQTNLETGPQDAATRIIRLTTSTSPPHVWRSGSSDWAAAMAFPHAPQLPLRLGRDADQMRLRLSTTRTPIPPPSTRWRTPTPLRATRPTSTLAARHRHTDTYAGRPARRRLFVRRLLRDRACSCCRPAAPPPPPSPPAKAATLGPPFRHHRANNYVQHHRPDACLATAIGDAAPDETSPGCSRRARAHALHIITATGCRPGRTCRCIDGVAMLPAMGSTKVGKRSGHVGGGCNRGTDTMDGVDANQISPSRTRPPFPTAFLGRRQRAPRLLLPAVQGHQYRQNGF